MFGQAQFQAGVIIDPIETMRFPSHDSQKLAEFREKIWFACFSVVTVSSADDVRLQAFGGESE